MGDELFRPRRIHICGCSGSGKTTLAKRLANALDVPFIELDSLFHLPNWQDRPRPEFIALVIPLAEEDAWIMDGNYSYVRDHTWSRADTVVFLDYPFVLVFWRICSRTFRRIRRREVLWNGNQEDPIRTLFSRDSIIWWMMTTWAKRRRDAIASADCPQLAGKSVHRFRSPKETEAWVRGLEK